MALALEVGGPALDHAGPRVLPGPQEPGQARHRLTSVRARAHRGEHGDVALRNSDAQREAHRVQELHKPCHVTALHDQVQRGPVVAGARPMLDAPLGRKDQQLAAHAGHEAGDDLGGERRQPGEPIVSRHGDDRQVRAAHQRAPGLEGPLLPRRVPEVRGRAEGGHGLVDELGIERGLRQGNRPGSRRCRR